MPRPRLLAAAALALSFALGLAASARAELWKWVDTAGVTHVTPSRESIPESFRSAAVSLDDGSKLSRGPLPLKGSLRPVPSRGDFPEAEPAAAAAPSAAVSTPAVAAPAPPTLPGPPRVVAPPLKPGDPRAAEIAELEAKIAADREALREIISTKRWDSSELASDPEVRELAERLPRLQAELDALRSEVSE